MKRLLITLGDSWTQGVGCYDETLRDKYNQGQATMQDLFLGSFDNFAKHSWPVYAAQHLNADIKNLGQGGDANSAAAKRLLLNTEDYSEYDEVVVVFLMTDPARFSFFHSMHKEGEIKSFNPGSPSPLEEKFCREFILNCLGGDKDELLEMVFYLKTVQYFCEINRYRFYYGSAFYKNMDEFHKIYPKTSSCIHPNFSCMVDVLDTEEMSDICYHPNIQGYKKIGNLIGEYIKQDLTKTT